MSRTIKSLIMAAACSAVASPLAAQTLPDPTRPPAAALEPAVRSDNAPSAPQLQSVLISPTRRVAVIDGQQVALGARLGEARVVRITEQEVTLKNGNDIQVLKLFPQIEKRPVPGAPQRKAEVKSK